MTGHFSELRLLENEIINCRKCPRLVSWREEVARVKRKAFMDSTYWGKPVPGFGDPNAKVFAVGLAPGAHGSNRTGRMFTGDGSGDFLYPVLHETGFANQPESSHSDDGLILKNLFITAVCRCVPPGNKPARDEILACQEYLIKEIQFINPEIFVALGKIAFDGLKTIIQHHNKGLAFTHGAIYPVSDQQTIVCSYHPSRQNTQTGRLNREMFTQIWQNVSLLISDK
ncbi:uracil-DNA glycosylase [Chloroflexota bacterium]